MYQILLECSTAHISWTDAELLKQEELVGHLVDTSAPLISVYSEGFFLYVPEENDYEDAMREANYTEPFIELIKYAKKQGAKIIRLDRDGDEIPARVLYDW